MYKLVPRVGKKSRCVTLWFHVTRQSSSSVTKLLFIDTFGYLDRNSRTSSLDNREQKDTSSSCKCLHCFNNLQKHKNRVNTLDPKEIWEFENGALLPQLGLPSTQKTLFQEKTLFKPEEFENAGFTFYCGQKTF